MNVHWLAAAAPAAIALVRDDEDRFDLIERAGAAIRAAEARLLAYCLAGSSLDAVVEGWGARAALVLEHALTCYARAFHRRHALEISRLRSLRVAASAIPKAEALALVIRKLHDKPSWTAAGRAIDDPWTSQRAYSGLSLAAAADVERGLELAGEHAALATGPVPRLADACPALFPSAPPETLLLAAAAVYGVRPWLLPSPSRALALLPARRLFIEVGRLESYSQSQLAPFLRRSQQQASHLATSEDVPERAVRIARTLARDPDLRRRLPGGAPPDARSLLIRQGFVPERVADW